MINLIGQDNADEGGRAFIQLGLDSTKEIGNARRRKLPQRPLNMRGSLELLP